VLRRPSVHHRARPAECAVFSAVDFDNPGRPPRRPRARQARASTRSVQPVSPTLGKGSYARAFDTLEPNRMFALIHPNAGWGAGAPDLLKVLLVHEFPGDPPSTLTLTARRMRRGGGSRGVQDGGGAHHLATGAHDTLVELWRFTGGAEGG